ncbi:hypothetical protein RGU77_16015 [Actimicrobium sp. CCI2.3]|nr:hypothetical protein [Actimicrobium sp. CCI2.3]MDY7575771.1 hypothetical protein [Actimicrobium sp. CCI2.3]
MEVVQDAAAEARALQEQARSQEQLVSVFQLGPGAAPASKQRALRCNDSVNS